MATTLTFISPGGTSHTVTIGKGDGTLIGTPEPFVIQEDDDDDIFLPIRKRTGYVNFIDDGTAWEGLIPTSATDVTVSCDDFFGFASPQTYGGKFLYRPTEYSLAIHCPLCALSSLKLSYDDYSGTTISFDNVLTLMATQLGNGIGFQKSTTAYNDYWDLKFQWSLLFDQDEDDGTFRAKYDNLSLLENILSFLGYTARSVGKTIVLVQPDRYVGNTTEVSSFLLADTNSSEELQNGIGKVEVKTSVSGDESNVVDIPFDEITEKNIQQAPITVLDWAYSQNDHVYFLRKGSTSPGSELDQSYTLGNRVVNFSTGNSAFVEFDVSNAPDYSGANVYGRNWSPAIKFALVSYTGTYVLRDISDVVTFKSGKFYLNGGQIVVKGSSFHFPDFTGTESYDRTTPLCRLVGVLRIGDKYFNGRDWVNAQTNNIPYFTIMSYNGQFGRNIRATSQQAYDTFFYPGIYIPINQPMEGEVEFGIGPLIEIDSSSIDFVYVDNLSVAYQRSTGFRTKTSHTYVAEGGTFSENLKIEPIFTSDTPRMKYGKELIIGANGFYGTGNTDIPPEWNLALRIASYRSQTRRLLNLNIREGDALAGLEPPFKILYSGKQYYPMSISRNPGQGVDTIKLIEIPNVS